MSAAPEIEQISFESLSTEDLLRERARVKVLIADIATQLQTQPGRPYTPEDESPEWNAFRAWRRRARWALVHHRRDFETIKELLRSKRDVSIANHRLRLAEQGPTEHDLAQQERGRQLRIALAEQDEMALLLRCYRLVRHLLPDSVDLPDTLDQDDRDALSLLSIRLRNAYGTGNLKAFVVGSDGTVPS